MRRSFPVWSYFGPSCLLLTLACGNATDAGKEPNGAAGLSGGSELNGGAPGATLPSGGTSAGANAGQGGNAGRASAGSTARGGASGSAGAPCSPVAHEMPALGTLSKDFMAVAQTTFGIYQVSAYYEQASSCDELCSARAAEPYLLVRPQEAYVRACSCGSVADCQAQAQKSYCNGSYQVDFTTAASDSALSGLSGYIVWPCPNNTCAGARYSVKLYELDADTIRIDGAGSYVEVPPFHNPETNLDGCYQTQIDNAALGAGCNRVQVLAAKRVASLP